MEVVDLPGSYRINKISCIFPSIEEMDHPKAMLVQMLTEFPLYEKNPA